MATRGSVVLEVLDEIYGPTAWANETLAERLPRVYDRSLERYKEYGYSDDEKDEYISGEVAGEVWWAYSDTDTCFDAAKRIIDGWKNL